MALEGIRGIATQIGRALSIAAGDDRTDAIGAAAGSGGVAPPGDYVDGPGIPVFPL